MRRDSLVHDRSRYLADSRAASNEDFILILILREPVQVGAWKKIALVFFY